MNPIRPARWIAEAGDGFLMAMAALASHKLRAALTLLGVIVGVFSIIVAMTAMRVLQHYVEQQLSGLGAHTFTVDRWPGITFEGPEGWEKYRRRKPLTLQMEMNLRERATLATAVGAEAGLGVGEVASAYTTTDPNIGMDGVTPDVLMCRNWNVQQGRGFTPGDIESARPVCVLGNKLAAQLFPHGTAVGRRVRFSQTGFLVIGVLEPGTGLGWGGSDNIFAVPITIGINPYSSLRSLTYYVQAPDQARYDDTVEQVRGILRALRKVPPGEPDDFEIFSNDSLIQQFRSFTLAVRLGVAVVSSIALLAAGIGIMNIMLVSVTERTREIGIRRAVGARKRNIMTQFILEAVVLCEVGGVAGVILGILGGNATAYFLKLPPVIPLDWVLIGLGICSLVGIVFGTYPAFKAAHLDPIESLRYE